MAEYPESDGIVYELNGEHEAPSTARLDRWLATLVSQGGSDLLLVAGAPACIRLGGEVKSIEAAPLEGREIEAAVLPALTQHSFQLYRKT